MSTENSNNDFLAFCNDAQQSWEISQGMDEFGHIEGLEGMFLAKLIKASLKKSKKGNWMVVREHVITEGDFSNAIISDFLVANDVTKLFAKIRSWIVSLGYEPPENLKELPSMLEQLQEASPILKIEVTVNDGFSSVEVLEVFDDDPTEEEENKPAKAEKKEESKPAKETKEKKPKKEKKVKAKKEEEEEEKQTLPDELLFKAKAFCVSEEGGVEISDDDTLEDIKEKINEYEWPKAEASEDIIKLFEELGLSSCLI